MATVPTPTTQSAGAVVLAATINSQGNLATYLAGRTESGGARKPLAVLRQSIAQSIGNNTVTAVLFDIEDVDYDNGHSTSTNTSRYTCGTTGWYLIAFGAHWAANATGFRDVWIQKNGSVNLPGRPVIQTVTGGVDTGASACIFATLTAGDYIEMLVNQNSGGALNTLATQPDQSYMYVEWRSV